MMNHFTNLDKSCQRTMLARKKPSKYAKKLTFSENCRFLGFRNIIVQLTMKHDIWQPISISHYNQFLALRGGDHFLGGKITLKHLLISICISMIKSLSRSKYQNQYKTRDKQNQSALRLTTVRAL